MRTAPTPCSRITLRTASMSQVRESVSTFGFCGVVPSADLDPFVRFFSDIRRSPASAEHHGAVVPREDPVLGVGPHGAGEHGGLEVTTDAGEILHVVTV